MDLEKLRGSRQFQPNSLKLLNCYEPSRSKTLFFDLNPKGAKSVYPGFPDAAGAGRILKSRSRPLPTHRGMKYFREETLAVEQHFVPNCGNTLTGMSAQKFVA